jgi:hypothetical protein
MASVLVFPIAALTLQRMAAPRPDATGEDAKPEYIMTNKRLKLPGAAPPGLASFNVLAGGPGSLS